MIDLGLMLLIMIACFIFGAIFGDWINKKELKGAKE